MPNKFIMAIACLFIAPAVRSQDQVKEMLESFASVRLWQYEEIPIDWKMKGNIQIDLNVGLNALVEGNPAIADSSLSRALVKDSTIWQAYYYRASARKQLHQLEFSKRDFIHVLRLNPKFPEAYIELAKVYQLIGKTSASDSSINLAITFAKSKALAYYVKGDINLVRENRADAVHSYVSCLEIDPNFHDARVKLTMSDFLSTYNIRGALQQLAKVLKKDSLQKAALFFRSIVSYDMNKKQSIRDLSSLIKVSPFNTLAFYFRGVLYTEVRKFDKAFSDFQTTIKQTATNENFFAGQQTMLDKKINLQNAGAYALTRIYGLPDQDSKRLKQAYCYLVINNFRGSIAVIDSISNPKEPLALYLKAVANEHMGNHSGAYVLYDEALKLDDQIADAHKKRGIYEQEMKHWDKSIEDFSAVLKLTTDAFLMYRLRGVSNYELSRFKAAADDFTSFLKIDSTNTDVISYRAMAYMQNKQMLEAYMDFAASGNKQMLDYSEMSKLVNALLVKGDSLRSMKALTIFTTLAPTYTDGFVQKLKVHKARNEWSEIEKILPIAIKNISGLTVKSDESYLYTLQAMIETRKGLDEQALNTFDRAILLDAKNKLAGQEKKKLLARLGRDGGKTMTKSAAKSQKNSSAVVLSGDWVRARAELLDGSEIHGNYYAKQPQRFLFIKNEVSIYEGCMENKFEYKIEGNKLRIANQVFTIESISDKAIHLLETTGNPIRHILIPTDSFTVTRKFHFIVNQDPADTVYTSTPGIEPQYTSQNFSQAVLMGAQSITITFDYVIQKDGTIGEVTINTISNESFRKRFIQNVKKTSGNWIPGAIGGKPVSVKCNSSVWRQ